MEGFGVAKQKFYIHYFLLDPETFTRCMNITKSSYFDPSLRKVVGFILDYSNEHRGIPPIALIKTECKYDPTDTDLADVTPTEIENLKSWFLNDYEKFCLYQDIAKKVMDAPRKIETEDYSGLVEGLRESLLISLQKDLGTEYFLDPAGRLRSLRENNNMTSTGWKSIDKKLYGGLNRGEVTIFAGNSGMGKSLFLQNIVLNWAELGLNSIYFTFELSEDLTAMRLDAMLSGIGTRDVMRDIDKVELEVKLKAKKCGNIQIKYMSPGTTANDVRAYLKEYQIQTGVKPDAIAVDYLDLMHPNNNKVSPSDLFVKDKYVSEELRSLVAEDGIICATASQLNRGAVDEQMHDIADIAGGLSKVNTVDNVITILTTAPMRERGEYKIQFIKTRSSAGVGSSLILKFDPVCLRITDMPDNYQPGQTTSVQETIRAQLKTKTEKINPETGEITEVSAQQTQDETAPASKNTNALDIMKKLKRV